MRSDKYPLSGFGEKWGDGDTQSEARVTKILNFEKENKLATTVFLIQIQWNLLLATTIPLLTSKPCTERWSPLTSDTV